MQSTPRVFFSYHIKSLTNPGQSLSFFVAGVVDCGDRQFEKDRQGRQMHLLRIAPNSLALVHRTLTPAGSFFIRTDHHAYWR